ncbi:rhotekin-2 isoform X1 [Amphiprion ocellaris]|uniref:REM-1 domain-containing protein n=1 Tax=Amphiprion ocellaris TaxID=80972 RepID=A0A3Q1AMM4_AMPOC|nr:rhotekin-2 isoform X1 [Amphiprion ocellaris]XP_054874397.1 rhotekin-2 isoform X1 [Amphiprion ocellaris]XP_054874398.1 rhotekin-2 isoform X1 [Amphiprion ocellaris]XP_054874399.1 rhotekin-2 isoform X1 [Amphiprion ocellaris]
MLELECEWTNNMDDQRDVQTSKRNGSCRSLLSAGSAVAMEIKRKKIRQSALFLQTEAKSMKRCPSLLNDTLQIVEDMNLLYIRQISKKLQSTNLQEKLDFEIRMREGAYKLLLACSKREQVLNASKNLLTCNARIKAYLTQLQKKKEEQDMMGAVRGIPDPVSDGRFPCSGTIAMSGLRIPMMWRDSDHFNNKGSSRRVAVFCVMQIGSEVFDTDMVVVDRSVTDICFEGVTIFKEAVPQFELRVELWSCALEEELTLVNTPKKLAKKFRSSFGKSGGKKLCSLLDTPDPDTFLQYNPIPSGAKYSLLAYTTLRLPEAEGSFQSHSLIVLQDAEWSSWLPLYGNLCCRLVAQPACMTQTMMTGYLNQKQSMEGMNRCCSLYCVLSGGLLSCYFTPEEIDAKVQPTLKVPINKDTRIRVMEKESAGRKSRSLSIINPSPEGCESIVFTTDTREELDDWLDALHQHLYDQSQWLHCCDQLMKIEVASPRKPSLFLTKQADSVYNDLSINSPSKFESITDIIHNKIEETDGRFLIGQDEEKEAPNWSTLFDGSHSVVVKKSILSQSKTSTPCSSPKPNSSSTPNSSKKRRAPPPPSDREPYAPPTRPARPPLPPSLLHQPLPSHQEKENSGASRPAARSKTGRPSLDAKFSAIIQQLQRNNTGGAAALSRKNAPLGVLDVQPLGHPQPPLQQLDYQKHRTQTPEATADHGFVRASNGPGPVPAPRSKLRKSFRERMNLKAL